MDTSNCTLKTTDTEVTLISETNSIASRSNTNTNDSELRKVQINDDLDEPVYVKTTSELKNNEVKENLLIKSNEKQQEITYNVINEITEDALNEKFICGCSKWANIKLFVFFMCLIVALTNALTVGYRNSVVTTIEKRFEISSIMSGMLSGSLELGSLIATLFVSYFFANRHIPRCIAISSLVCAIGSFMYAIPHFLSGSYTITNKVMNKTTNDLICRINDEPVKNINHSLPLSLSSSSTSASLDNENCFKKQTDIIFFMLLAVANLLIGSSSAPLYTLGTTYIDNHVCKNNSSVYLSFMYSMLALGPVVGYLLGAWFLRVYVDVLEFSLKEIKLSVTDSGFVGAWWIGFIVIGVFIFFTSFPFFCFPKSIRSVLFN